MKKKSGENNPSVEAALEIFADAADMEQRIRALKDLMRGGVIYSIRSDARFVKGIDQAINEMNSITDPKQTLLAFTVLTRIASRIRSERDILGKQLAISLQSSPSTLSELSDADDRAYAAQALQWASGDWVIPYVARSIVEEETGEKTRSELIRILLDKTPDIATGLGALRSPLVDWRPATENPSDTVARRLIRISVAFRRELLLREDPPGDDLGEVFQGLISDCFKRVGKPSSFEVSGEVASEVANFLHDVVRTRFSLAIDSNTYGALRVVSRWFPERVWPKTTRKPLDILASDIQEAITLLAKQRITDEQLLKYLIIIEGSREDALKITSGIANRMTGLSAEVSEWLRRGRSSRRAPGAELRAESSQLAADPALALLLIDSRRMLQMLEGSGQDLLNEVRVFEPNLEQNTETLLNMSQALASGVQALAGKRSLTIRGKPGELVDYSPLEHEGIGGPIIGARRVRIVRPLVERIRAGKTSEIVIKAVVEPE